MSRWTPDIVMGTRGLGSIQGLLMGSVAMKVIHLAEVPITLLNSRRIASAGAAISWKNSNGP
jgi:hypothetical protein